MQYMLNILVVLANLRQFHLVIRMLYLFGFRLHETHHRYLLASSFTDFWRRIYHSLERLHDEVGLLPELLLAARQGKQSRDDRGDHYRLLRNLDNALLPVVLAARRVPNRSSRCAVLGHSWRSCDLRFTARTEPPKTTHRQTKIRHQFRSDTQDTRYVLRDLFSVVTLECRLDDFVADDVHRLPGISRLPRWF